MSTIDFRDISDEEVAHVRVLAAAMGLQDPWQFAISRRGLAIDATLPEAGARWAWAERDRRTGNTTRAILRALVTRESVVIVCNTEPERQHTQQQIKELSEKADVVRGHMVKRPLSAVVEGLRDWTLPTVGIHARHPDGLPNLGPLVWRTR